MPSSFALIIVFLMGYLLLLKRVSYKNDNRSLSEECKRRITTLASLLVFVLRGA